VRELPGELCPAQYKRIYTELLKSEAFVTMEEKYFFQAWLHPANHKIILHTHNNLRASCKALLVALAAMVGGGF